MCIRDRNSSCSTEARGVKVRKFGFMGSMSLFNQSIRCHNSFMPEMRKRSKSAVTLGKILRTHSTRSLKIKDDYIIKDEKRDSGVVVDNHEAVVNEKNLNHFNEKKRFKLNELLDMEERYFGDLIKTSTMFAEMRKSMEDPDYPVQMPAEFQRIFSVFLGNFREIRNFHKALFTDKMRDVIWSADLMMDLLRKSQYNMKSIYGKYCRNWRKCEYILKKYDPYFRQMEEYLESEARVQDQMIKPIQTINRYHLFFTALVKICEQLDKSEEHILYTECLEVTKDMSKYVNDIIATGRIENLPESKDINSQGNLLKRGFAKRKVDVLEIPVHMFLFEKSFIVCYHKKAAREFELSDEYRYWTMFQINQMEVENGENREFVVTDTLIKKSVTFAVDTDQEVEDWIRRIRKEIKNIDRIVKMLMMQPVSMDTDL